MEPKTLDDFEAALDELRARVLGNPLARRFTGSNITLDGEPLPPFVELGHIMSAEHFAHLFAVGDGSIGTSMLEQTSQNGAPPGLYLQMEQPWANAVTRVGLYRVSTPREEDGWDGLFLDMLRIGNDAPPGLGRHMLAAMALAAYDLGLGELISRGNAAGLFEPAGGEVGLHRFDLDPGSASWGVMCRELVTEGAASLAPIVHSEPDLADADFPNTRVLPAESLPRFGGFTS